MNFKDSANRRIGYLAYNLVSGETSESVVIRVVPSAGAALVSEQSDAVALKAREHGTSDPFADLAEGIDLSGYTPGEPVDFDLIAQAEEGLTGLIRVALFLGVVSSGGAAWSG